MGAAPTDTKWTFIFSGLLLFSVFILPDVAGGVDDEGDVDVDVDVDGGGFSSDMDMMMKMKKMTMIMRKRMDMVKLE